MNVLIAREADSDNVIIIIIFDTYVIFFAMLFYLSRNRILTVKVRRHVAAFVVAVVVTHRHERGCYLHRHRHHRRRRRRRRRLRVHRPSLALCHGEGRRRPVYVASSSSSSLLWIESRHQPRGSGALWRRRRLVNTVLCIYCTCYVTGKYLKRPPKKKTLGADPRNTTTCDFHSVDRP